MRRRLSMTGMVMAMASFVLLVPMKAVADDNVTGDHWHEALPPYQISTSFPDDWVIPVLNASEEWDGFTLFAPTYGGRIVSTDWADLDSHIVWRDQIPAAFHDNCPPETTLACTSWRTFADGHIADADIVFNEEREMGRSDFACNFLGAVTTDIHTVALHEFGHFGGLLHTVDDQAVMFGSYVDCRRELTQHDMDSMNGNYPGH
jgi:hypothetical protein